MRISVDPARCQGHNVCAMVAADLFVLNDDDGHAVAVSPAVPQGFEDLANRAASGCPEQAITIEP